MQTPNLSTGGAAAPRTPRARLALAAAASLATALIALPLARWLDLANVAMLFTLTVLLVALWLGRAPAAAAAVIGIAAILMAAPRFAFDASGLQYAITFGVLLAVGQITAGLTAGLRRQARAAVERERRTRTLYEFARALSGTLQAEQVIAITADFVQRAYAVQAAVLAPDAGGRLGATAAAQGGLHLSVLELATAQWAFDSAACAGTSTDTLPDSRYLFLPLVAPVRTRGVLALYRDQPGWQLTPEQRRQLDAFAALAAIALERVHYVEVAQSATVSVESERLRNSLLQALSHDLRTPLTSLVGLSEALARSRPELSAPQREAAEGLRDEALRMSKLVSNLLEMAAIQSGRVQLELQWHAIVEVIGSALRASAQPLASHRVETRVAPELPLVRFDVVLIERVLCNLFENAAKYTPPGSRLTIEAAVDGPALRLTVSDDGPGLPPGMEEAIFEKFTRGQSGPAVPGVGLGLAICRAIVAAHGGTIGARNLPSGGAAFSFTLPLGQPPALDWPDDHEQAAPGAAPSHE